MDEQWPVNFDLENERRLRIRAIINSSPDPRETAKEYYSNNLHRFVKDCCVTYDPRNPSIGLPSKIPLVPFKKQCDFLTWLLDMYKNQTDGLVEKTRDMGATWIACSFSTWLWLFEEGSAVGWGSRKEMLVDRFGDPDSIFEKIRMLIENLPWYLIPEGFNRREHFTFMKCLNPENESIIAGEAGNNIGRGGRKSIYLKDESAHYERPESIEAALGDNTNVQIDISSVNGEGNVFYRKRHGNIVKVFIMDWSDHPGKSKEWYEKRKAKAMAEGLTAEFAQEVDRDYAAAVEGIFIPSEYAKAMKDAHLKLGIKPEGVKKAGLDVADEGGDKNALVGIHGVVVTHIEQWGKGDTDYTTKRANEYCVKECVETLRYDSIGVGAGVKGSLASMKREGNLSLNVSGFNAGDGVVNPEKEFTKGKKNKDMFANAKAQAWWEIFDRALKTYQAVVEGKKVDLTRILSIPSEFPLADELISELSRPKKIYDSVGRIKVEPKDKMKARGIPSPNLADALVMCYAPEKQMRIHIG